MDAKAIGARLKALREAKGQTKRYVARQTGCSYNSVCSYEYALRVPGDDAKVKLAKHFGVSVEEIFFADDITKRGKDAAKGD